MPMKKQTKLYQCLKTSIDSVHGFSVLIQFLCGLCPEAGSFSGGTSLGKIEMYVIKDWNFHHFERQQVLLTSLQNLILKTTKGNTIDVDCCTRYLEKTIKYYISQYVLS